MKMPVRPEPKEKISDYDDGDPYSCMAAGRAEYDMQKSLQRQVMAARSGPPESLQSLIQKDSASVQTAFYDIWLENRGKDASLASWAAEQMKLLGNASLAEYDLAHPAR